MDASIEVKYMKKMNIRILASSMYSSDELLNLHSFRRDLYFRISDCIIELTPLRERIEDIKSLTNQFIMNL